MSKERGCLTQGGSTKDQIASPEIERGRKGSARVYSGPLRSLAVILALSGEISACAPVPSSEKDQQPTSPAVATAIPSATATVIEKQVFASPTETPVREINYPPPTFEPTTTSTPEKTPTQTEIIIPTKTNTPTLESTPTVSPTLEPTATATKEAVWQFEQVVSPEYAQLNLWRPEDAERLVQMGLITQDFNALSARYTLGSWQDFKFAPKPQVYIWQKFLNDLHTYQLFPNVNPEYQQWYGANKDKMSGWEQREIVLAYASSHNGILVAPGGVKFDIRNGLHFTAQLGPSFSKEMLPDGLVWGDGVLGLICRVNKEGRLEIGTRNPNCETPGVRCDITDMNFAKFQVCGSINMFFAKLLINTFDCRRLPPEKTKVFPYYLIDIGALRPAFNEKYGPPPEELVPYLP